MFACVSTSLPVAKMGRREFAVLAKHQRRVADNCAFVCCSGRLMRDRSQSSFAVTYKNMKKSPSLQSLDNVSIDSYLLEDGDTFSLMERGAGTCAVH